MARAAATIAMTGETPSRPPVKAAAYGALTETATSIDADSALCRSQATPHPTAAPTSTAPRMWTTRLTTVSAAELV